MSVANRSRQRESTLAIDKAIRTLKSNGRVLCQEEARERRIQIEQVLADFPTTDLALHVHDYGRRPRRTRDQLLDQIFEMSCPLRDAG